MSVPMNLPDLPSVTGRISLRETVARELRAALVTGKLAPGRVYSAPALASRFGVSATPVREAMLDLVKEGLVVAVRNKGFRVSELSESDLDDCVGLRRLIEPPALAAVTRTAGAEQLEAWRGAAEAIVAAAEGGDLAAYIDADVRFHLGLLSLSGNRLLVDTVRHLRYRSRLYGVPALAESGRLTPSAAEHVELLDLMVAGEADAVEALMHRHLDHVRGIWSSAAVASGDNGPGQR